VAKAVCRACLPRCERYRTIISGMQGIDALCLDHGSGPRAADVQPVLLSGPLPASESNAVSASNPGVSVLRPKPRIVIPYHDHDPTAGRADYLPARHFSTIVAGHSRCIPTGLSPIRWCVWRCATHAPESCHDRDEEARVFTAHTQFIKPWPLLLVSHIESACCSHRASCLFMSGLSHSVVNLT